MEDDPWLAARASKTGLRSESHHRRNPTVKCPKMQRSKHLTSREARGRAQQDGQSAPA